MVKLIPLLLSTFFATALAAQMQQEDRLPAFFDLVQGISGDGVNVRLEPRSDSELIGTLRPDASSVEIVGFSDDRLWGRLNILGESGWTQMNALVRQPDSYWAYLDMPLFCDGDDLSWGATFDFQSSALALKYHGAGHGPRHLPEDQNTGEFQITWTENWGWPAWDRPVNVLINFQKDNRESFAVIHEDQCNDGVREAQYGLRIELRLRRLDDTDTDRFIRASGCCHLALRSELQQSKP